MTIKPFAFVLMPFDSKFSDIYKLGIQAAANECDVIAERVDEQSFSETILERIYRQIDIADFIIADMSGRNPNVFYEVGYAHAKEKLCTLLTHSAEDIPFDLRHHRHIIYNGSIQNLKEKLIIEINWIKDQITKKQKNPLTLNLKKCSGELEKDSYYSHAIIDFVFDIRNNTNKKSPEIEAIYLHTGPNWIFKQDSLECPSEIIESSKGITRHFLKALISKLSPGSWAQIKIVGRRLMWNKFSGEDSKEKYCIKGRVFLEMITTDGSHKEPMDISIDVEEFPF